MPFVEDLEMTERGISYEMQKACYESNYARIEMALSMPMPVQPNAVVNANQNTQPNVNPNAHQIPQTAVNTIVQLAAQDGNQTSQQGASNTDGHNGTVKDGATLKGSKTTINSWVAFRSHNQKALMLVGFPQWFRSKFLGSVWRIEPFRAKFEIMATAFSRIRAVTGIRDGDIRDFIEICVPMMRVMNVDDYFETGGLKYTIDADDEIHLTGEITIPNKDLYNTSISANELIRACHERGFFEGELSSILSPGDQFEQGVAGASNQHPSSGVASRRSGPKKHSNNDLGAVTVFRYPEGYLEAKAARKVLHPSQFSPGGCPAQQTGLLLKSSAYSLGSIKYQRRLLNDNYPYYASFDPDQNTAYVYCPWIGDDSDAFEIGDGFSDAHAYRP